MYTVGCEHQINEVYTRYKSSDYSALSLSLMPSVISTAMRLPHTMHNHCQRRLHSRQQRKGRPEVHLASNRIQRTQRWDHRIHTDRNPGNLKHHMIHYYHIRLTSLVLHQTGHHTYHSYRRRRVQRCRHPWHGREAYLRPLASPCHLWIRPLWELREAFPWIHHHRDHGGRHDPLWQAALQEVGPDPSVRRGVYRTLTPTWMGARRDGNRHVTLSTFGDLKRTCSVLPLKLDPFSVLTAASASAWLGMVTNA